MGFEDVATLGFAARRLSEDAADDGFVVPFWVIITIVVLTLTLLLCGCTCFVIRCFAPEVTQGPAWEVNSYGTQRVKGIHPGDEGEGRTPVAHSKSSESYPGGIPVHDPNHNVYDGNNVRRDMRPKNFQDPNEPEYAKQRQEVLDRLNGMHLGHGGGRLAKNSEVNRQELSV